MSIRHRPTRESFIKKGARKFTDKRSDAVAYVWESTGVGRTGASVTRFHAQVFFGKAAKPAANYYYATAEQRERSVVTAFEGRRARSAMMDKIKQERQAPNGLVVGDILSYSFGYNMTTVEFYQVVEVAGRHVVIRRIGSKVVSTYHDGGKVEAVPGEFIGEPIRKLVQNGTKVTIQHGRHASKWDGQPKSFTDYD